MCLSTVRSLARESAWLFLAPVIFATSSLGFCAGASERPPKRLNVLFLAADDSDGITGQHVLVDAGIAQQSVIV